MRYTRMTRTCPLWLMTAALIGQCLFSNVACADPLRAGVHALIETPVDTPFAWPDLRLNDTQEDERARDYERTTTTRRPRTLLESLFGREENATDREEPEGEGRLDPDRPHLPEASTTVGKGRIVLESGYTFSQKGSTFSSNSYPEALLRVGLFADWFEVRIGQSFLSADQTVDGVQRSVSGAQDLYLGVKVALTEQKQYLPEIALIPQMTVPTGSHAVSAGRVLPGLNVDCAWEVIKAFFNIELLVATNRVPDGPDRSHVEFTTGLTGVVSITRRLEAFAEWDAFYPLGATDPTIGQRHYGVGGLVYFITNNLEVDVRAGVGLNKRANDFLTGAGFAVRY